MYHVIIGDVINSKEIEDRNQFQSQLNTVLNDINSAYKETILSRFEVTLGDEFQGLLTSNAPILEIIDMFQFKMLPYKIRWGIGSGLVNTKITPENVGAIDGPAFWNARKAIEHVHKVNFAGKSRCFYYVNQQESNSINSVLRLHDAISDRWTDAQVQIIIRILEDYGYESYVNKVVALKQNISPQRVSNAIAATNFKQYTASRKIVQRSIQEGKV